MRSAWLTSVWLAVGGTASAEPCRVTIAHAPAELRATLDGALIKDRAQCRVTLELRAVATEGGYYLLARDLHGRVRERIVPDAASAATLVTSWAADDELDDTTQRSEVPPPPPEPEPAEEPVVVATAAPVAPSLGPAVAIYGVLGQEGPAVRVDLDVFRSGHWSLGVSAKRLTNLSSYVNSDSAGLGASYSTIEYDVLAYASYRLDLSDSWHLRGAVGAGAALIDVTYQMPVYDSVDIAYSGTGAPTPGTGGFAVAPMVDALLAIDADLAGGLSLVAGVSIDSYVGTPTFDISDNGYLAGQIEFDHTSNWSALAGLRYEL